MNVNGFPSKDSDKSDVGPAVPAGQGAPELHFRALDRLLALSRVGGDLELLQEIAQLFLNEAPNMMAAIETALRAGDARSLEHAAHSFKGSVSSFGAQSAHDAALRLERLGRCKDLADAPRAFRDLRNAVAELGPELQSLVGCQQH
jgi:HPt (histidine-containing phosphotransfer) domain-containing protein